MFDLISRIRSYNIVEVKTVEPEKILNMIQKRGIAVWDTSYSGMTLKFKVVNADIGQINELLKRFSTSVEVREYLGAEKALHFLKKRKIFFIMLAVVSLFVIYFGTFIWKIEIYGARTIKENDVLMLLYENDIRQSSKKSAIDENAAEILILNNFPQISDASVAIVGSTLKVTLVERESPIVQYDKSVPVDLIASKDATVDEIAVYNGVQKVKKGAAVKQGDVLISGVIKYDYRDKPAESYVHALGKVLTYEKIEYGINIDLYEPQEGAPAVTERVYYLFGRSFSWTDGKKDDSMLCVVSKNNIVRLEWIELPILYDELKWYNIENCTTKSETKIYDEIYTSAKGKITDKQSIRSINYQINSVDGKSARVEIVINCATNIAVEQKIH